MSIRRAGLVFRLDEESSWLDESDPEIPIWVPDAPASAELFQCHITFVDAREAVGTAWRIHSISSTRPSVRTALTEQERFSADWYPDLLRTCSLFHSA